MARHADALFAAWCEGRTGYPLVDAAMHQINQTGYMHNRLRMVVASFLTKDLGLDWRRGERYFATHLNDFDLAANNGGWQWAASTRLRRAALLPHLQPGEPEREVRCRRASSSGATCRNWPGLPDKLIHAPWLARPVDLAAAEVRLGVHYPLPAGGARRGA
jgi:deoxyribodipyrimidine photo-lyase